jgi:glucose-6-phosphate 1-dehydrogenase
LQEREAKKNGAKGLKLPRYAAGTWGPKEADDLLAKDGRYWRNPASLHLLR